jgi:hypothetical protein
MLEPMLRIDSTQNTWLFDVERMRFRRLPRDADPGAPSRDRDWEPYFALEMDSETGVFTVALNADRTRLLRASRDDGGGDGNATGELRFRVSARS